MKTLRTGATVFVALLALFPLHALAGVPSDAETVEIRVSYADLNIKHEAGAKVLYARLRSASKKACGVYPHRERGSLMRISGARQCYRDKMDELVSKIDSAELKKLHRG